MKALHLMVFVAVLLMAACGPTFEEKGFASEEEAGRLSALGFPTFNALMETGRFKNTKQAREAVAKGFYNLDDYEKDLYQQYVSENFTLEEAAAVAVTLTNIDLNSSLISQKIVQISQKYPAKFDLRAGEMMGTAPPEVCDSLAQAAEKIKSEWGLNAMRDFVTSTCNGVLTLAKEAKSLVSPGWVPADNLPQAWGEITNLSAKNGGPCEFGGFEKLVMFKVTAPKNNTKYSFFRAPAPAGVDWSADSMVSVSEHKVWVSALNPNLYLMFDKFTRGYAIISERDNHTYGKHLALDGKPFDPFSVAKFTVADYQRWSVDISATSKFGDEDETHTVCDEKSYSHLLDHKWTSRKQNLTLSLRSVLR
jgi:hypothetical protein